jgi:hypothetical protein
MKQIYKKRNFKYWTVKSLNKHSMQIWIDIIILMAFFTLWALARHYTDNLPKADPRASVVSQVMASEPDYKVSCEDPKGYLECQVYNGKISWEQHEKMSKIIKCESGWNPEAINTKNTNGSYDMGLVQINSIHKTVKNSDKLNFKFSIDWMINKVNKDGGYGAWSCARKLNIK